MLLVDCCVLMMSSSTGVLHLNLMVSLLGSVKALTVCLYTQHAHKCFPLITYFCLCSFSLLCGKYLVVFSVCITREYVHSTCAQLLLPILLHHVTFAVLNRLAAFDDRNNNHNRCNVHWRPTTNQRNRSLTGLGLPGTSTASVLET